MKVLALDMATKTGWAFGCSTTGLMPQLFESGVQEFVLNRGESPGMRFLRFRGWLDTMLASTDPDVVVFEQAHHRGGAATELGVGFATRVQEEAARRGIEHAAVHTATLKKWATGNGRASKEEMIEAARARWGVAPSDDNEADALLLLAWALEVL